MIFTYRPPPQKLYIEDLRRIVPFARRKATKMILGMSTPLFTQIHVIISLIAIGSGFIVAFGMIAGRLLPRWTALFVVTTVLTSVTGFFFPIHGVTPGIVLGVVSLAVLLFVILARYSKHLSNSWRRTYVITAMIALWLNFFVLIAQSFQKIPALHTLAPTGTEPAFKISQLIALILFVTLTILADKKFRFASPDATA